MITTLESFDFTRHIGNATVEMAPVGVAGLISPWNSDAFFICDKLATAWPPAAPPSSSRAR
jgi:aldehyde dehydrogenase (NAD+)